MAGPYLILGATGTVGRRVLALMAASGHDVRGATRKGAGRGFVTLDLLDPAGHAAALDGVKTVMLMSRPGDEEAHVHAAPFIKAMVEQGVRRVVVLSALGAEKYPDFSLRKVELLVERSGLEWTHVRPNFFMQMLAAPPLCHEIAWKGTLSLPLGGARVAYVDADDVAAVLVRALLDRSLSGRGVDVNGPVALDHGEVAARISRAAGRDVAYVNLTEEDARRLLTDRGLTAPHVERVLRFYALTRAGACAAPDSTVAALLGRPLGTFEAFAARHAAAWSPPGTSSDPGAVPRVRAFPRPPSPARGAADGAS